MDFYSLLNLATTIVVVMLVIPLVCFAWIYDRGSVPPEKRRYAFGRGIWRKSTEGRTLMAQKLVIMLFLVLIIVSRIWGSSPSLELFKTITYVSAGIIFWVMLGILIKTLKKE